MMEIKASNSWRKLFVICQMDNGIRFPGLHAICNACCILRNKHTTTCKNTLHLPSRCYTSRMPKAGCATFWHWKLGIQFLQVNKVNVLARIE